MSGSSIHLRSVTGGQPGQETWGWSIEQRGLFAWHYHVYVGARIAEGWAGSEGEAQQSAEAAINTLRQEARHGNQN